MARILISLVILATVASNLFAQLPPTPPVIKKMEAMGTVYLTWRDPQNKNAKSDAKPNVIIGIDFRPTAGTDPKKVAEVVKELATLRDLEFVLLLGKSVTDEAADAIPATPKVSRLQFFNTGIGDKGISGLTRFQNLQTFHFTGMGITDAGMKDLAKIKTLRNLTIIDAKITDQGVLALQTLPLLRQLTVENTAASQKSIDRLHELLPRLGVGELNLR